MSNIKKLKFVYVVIFIFALTAFAYTDDIPVGKQLSEVIPAGSYPIVVRSDDPQIRKIDIIVNLQSDVILNGAAFFSDTFQVQIQTFQDDFNDPPVLDNTIDIGVDGAEENFTGDKVSVFRRDTSSLRRFVIRIKFHSYFNKNPDCQHDAGAAFPQTKKKVTITMNHLSAGHLQAYVHGFTGVPAGTGTPCDSGAAGYDVIDSTELTFIKNLAAPVAKPIHVMLVLDVSGSMNYPLSPPSKIQILHEGTRALLDTWVPFSTPDDQVGVVFFTTTASLYSAGVPFTPSPYDPGPWLNLRSEVYTHTAGGRTAMGPGLQLALDNFDPGSEHLRHIILFTNGMQNEPVGNLLDFSGPYCVLNSVTLQDYAVPIHVAGTGVTTGSSYEEMLEKIAENTGGNQHFMVNLADALSPTYWTNLVDMLRNNSPAITGIYTGTIKKGNTIKRTFQVNQAAKKAVFVVDWHATDPDDRLPAARPIRMEVFRPGSNPNTGTPITLEATKHVNNLHRGTASFPLPGGVTHEGIWTMKIIAESDMHSAGASWHAAVIVDEAELYYHVGAEPMDYGTGDPIVLTASLKIDGKGVTNADTVECAVTRPRNALGTFLNQYNPDAPIPPDPVALSQSDDRFSNLYSWKLHQLIEKQGLGHLLEPIKDPNPVTLVHKGNGKYQARFTNTKLPGQYKFDFIIKGNHPLIGKYERMETSSAIVRVKTADPDKSEISCETQPGGKKLVTVVPVDKFDNFLGPGYEQNVTVTSSAGTVGPVKDERINGTYTAVISNLPPAGDPNLTIKVNGKALKENTPCGKVFTPKWIFGAYIGRNLPHSWLNTLYDPGLSLEGIIEDLFTPRFSIFAAVGYNKFKIDPVIAGIADDLKIINFSGNLKFYPVIGTFQLAVFGGGGFYLINPGDDKFGINFGGSAELRLTAAFSIEAKYNRHTVFTAGDNLTFSTFLGGIRIRF